MNDKYLKLTKRELEVMRIFWGTENALTAVEVLNYYKDTNMSIFNIQNILRSLLSKGAIEVSAYSRVLKTTARNYRPILTANDYATIQFLHNFPQNEKPQFFRLVATLLKLEKDENELETIKKLEEMIAVRKAELQRVSKEEGNDNDLGDTDDNNN